MYGNASANSANSRYGVVGRAAGSGGVGVYGTHASTSGTNPGVYGITSSTTAGNSSVPGATGVLGKVNSTAPGAYTAGVAGINNSTSGAGVGVYGRQAGTGWGVFGAVPGGTGVGVYGYNPSSTGFGLYSNGDLGVGGGGTLECPGCIPIGSMGFPTTAAFTTEFFPSTFSEIPAICTNYDSITIVAPSAGTVLLQATVQTRLNHTNGTDDTLVAALGDTTTDCNPTGGFEAGVVEVVPAGASTADGYFSTSPLLRTVSVTAGSHTYYLNAYMDSGQDVSDLFGRAKMTAMFIG